MRALIVTKREKLQNYFGDDFDKYVQNSVHPTPAFQELLSDADHADSDFLRSCVIVVKVDELELCETTHQELGQ